jgi:eukaryotic-like serine/threonine-protein kinase
MSAAAVESPAPRLPRTFGPYTLFDFVGRGGMAEIYLARQKTEFSGARLCVVKQILPELAGDRKFSEMLVHEAKLAARLSHANIVQVFDLGREDDRLYIAMEYVEGFDLNEVLRRCARNQVALPFELSVHVIREALRGLDYAHRRTNDDGSPLGLVHRDVSPSNLLLSFHGEVKLCDFGIARANDLLGDSGGPGFGEALKGKAGYMSPEHARGEPIDARADVFAAGIVLWELAAGRRMHKAGGTGEEALERARGGEVPELPETGLPEESQLRAILGKALSPLRESRYSSAAGMLRDLEDYAAAARLLSSPLQLGDWLEKTFGEEILVRRRSRERAIAALERGPLVQIEPLAPPTSSPFVAGTVDLGPPSSETAPRAALAARPRRGARAFVVAVLVALFVIALVLAMAKGR